MGAFIEADIEKLERFVSQSAETIKEFQEIKDKLNEINSTLLSSWKGHGANAYKSETDHILEKIGSLKDVLNTLNDEVISSIIDTYNQLDDALTDFNRNPVSEE